GTALIGGSLKLINGQREFRVYVTDVALVDSWAQPLSGVHITLETYKLDVAEIVAGLPGDRSALCPHPPGETDDSLTMKGQFAYYTLLFEGDRIKATPKLDT